MITPIALLAAINIKSTIFWVINIAALAALVGVIWKAVKNSSLKDAITPLVIIIIVAIVLQVANEALTPNSSIAQTGSDFVKTTVNDARNGVQ